MKNYALEILQQHLMGEMACNQDAVTMLNKGSLSTTAKEAFTESLQLTRDRIPELESAIEVIQGGEKVQKTISLNIRICTIFRDYLSTPNPDKSLAKFLSYAEHVKKMRIRIEEVPDSHGMVYFNIKDLS